MMTLNKVIKNLATLLAIFLIVCIFSFLILGIGSLVSYFSPSKEIHLGDGLIKLENSDIENLEINLKSSKLIIKESSTLQLETNNEKIEAHVNHKTLSIKENKYQFIHRDDLEVILYLPSDILFNEVEIEGGFGIIEIESLQTNQLSLELKAGSTSIHSLIVLEEATIKGGAGEIRILSGHFTNLDVDMGVGKLDLTSRLEGNTKIKAGIGEVKLQVLNSKNDYTLKLNKGIGNIKVDSETIEDKIIGSGNKVIEIEGGIGNISLDFTS